MKSISQRALYRTVLLVVLLAFVVWRGSQLNVPFYWDEAWVYAPAVKAMTDTGVSFLPSGLDPLLSRGHPLLFHGLATAWATMFGTSAIALHSFALLIAVLLILAVYELGRSIGEEAVGLGSALFVLVNEAFIAQSGLLLPELMLALWVVLSVYFYLKRSYLGYIACASCALLTKEAALAPILAFSVWQLVLALWGGNVGKRAALKWSLVALVPLCVGAGFLLLQYLTFGWVFFPEHIAMMTWDMKDLAYKSRVIFTAIFEEQGRLVFTYASTFIATLLWKQGSKVNRWVGALLFIAVIKALWGRWPIPFIPEPLSSLLLLVVLCFVLFIPFYRVNGRAWEILPLTFLVTVAFWGFSALNFYTDRYLLVLYPLLAIAGMFYLKHVLDHYRQWLFPAVALVCIVVQAERIGKDEKVGDTRLSYLDAIATDKAMIRFCEEQDLYDASIGSDFIQVHYMQDVGAGYLGSKRTFTNMVSHSTTDSQYAIVTSNTQTVQLRERDSTAYSRIHRVEIGKAWSELYVRRSQ